MESVAATSEAPAVPRCSHRKRGPKNHRRVRIQILGCEFAAAVGPGDGELAAVCDGPAPEQVHGQAQDEDPDDEQLGDDEYRFTPVRVSRGRSEAVR